MPKKFKTKTEIVRLEGSLKEIITLRDDKGNVVHSMMKPLMVEFHPKDLFQVIVGAAILAIPVGFTEEAWRLGQILPASNILLLFLLSLLFISTFVYYNYYTTSIREQWDEFLKRVLVTYVVSFLVAAVLLTLIQRTPWTTDWVLALKRSTIVAFPASMSAAVADLLK